MPPTTALDLTGGITEYSSRIALKALFGQFGAVTACWIPPLETRGQERAYVKFGTTAAAKAAYDAATAGALYLDGVPLKAEWRMSASRTQDSRDFEARGSNLMTSRDLMRAQRKQQMDRDDIKRTMRKQLEDRERAKDTRGKSKDRRGKSKDRRDKSKSKARSRDRDRRRSRERSRDRDRKRDRSKSKKSRDRSRSKRKKSRSKSKSKSKAKSSSSSSSSSSKSRRKKKKKEKKTKDEKSKEDMIAIEDESGFTEDGGTSAVL